MSIMEQRIDDQIEAGLQVEQQVYDKGFEDGFRRATELISEKWESDELKSVEETIKDTLNGMAKAEKVLSNLTFQECSKISYKLIEQKGRLYYRHENEHFNGSVYYQHGLFHYIQAVGKAVSMMSAMSLDCLLEDVNMVFGEDE